MIFVNNLLRQQQGLPFFTRIMISVAMFFVDFYIAENMKDFLDADDSDESPFSSTKASIIEVHGVIVSSPSFAEDEGGDARDWCAYNVRDATGEIQMTLCKVAEKDIMKSTGMEGVEQFQKFFTKDKQVRIIRFAVLGGQEYLPEIISIELFGGRKPIKQASFERVLTA